MLAPPPPPPPQAEEGAYGCSNSRRGPCARDLGILELELGLADSRGDQQRDRPLADPGEMDAVRPDEAVHVRVESLHVLVGTPERVDVGGEELSRGRLEGDPPDAPRRAEV